MNFLQKVKNLISIFSRKRYVYGFDYSNSGDHSVKAEGYCKNGVVYITKVTILKENKK